VVRVQHAFYGRQRTVLLSAIWSDKAVLNIAEETVRRTVHTEGFKDIFFEVFADSHPRSNLNKPGDQFMSEAVQKVGPRLKGYGDFAHRFDILAKGIFALFLTQPAAHIGGGLVCRVISAVTDTHGHGKGVLN